MMRKALLIPVVAITLAGCGSKDEAPTREDRACDSIQSLTPGSLELGWAVATLADKNATAEQRADALHVTVAKDIQYQPYTCSGPVFERYLTEFTN